MDEVSTLEESFVSALLPLLTTAYESFFDELTACEPEDDAEREAMLAAEVRQEMESE